MSNLDTEDNQNASKFVGPWTEASVDHFSPASARRKAGVLLLLLLLFFAALDVDTCSGADRRGSSLPLAGRARVSEHRTVMLGAFRLWSHRKKLR